MTSLTYKYHYRPCYGSDKLLIEFFSNTEEDGFFTDVLGAINEMNPEIITLDDLWMNDEIMYTINSDLGQFTFSKDSWGFAFIMNDDHPDYLAKINDLLIKDGKFEKIDVDFEKYTLDA